MDQLFRLLHACGMPPADADVLHGKGPAMGAVLASAEPRSTLFTGSQRVAEKLALDLRGKVGGRSLGLGLGLGLGGCASRARARAGCVCADGERAYARCECAFTPPPAARVSLGTSPHTHTRALALTYTCKLHSPTTQHSHTLTPARSLARTHTHAPPGVPGGRGL